MTKKIDEKKSEKEKSILEASYILFIEKGINNTSIQDIVDKAGVAKGTFYLYFQDKYQLQEKLITRKSHQLFNEALYALKKNNIENFSDGIIFVINYVIDILIEKPELISLISKDLSLGVYSDSLTKIVDNDEIGLYETFMNATKEKDIKLNNPEVTLFMIIELVSSTCFSSIINKKPLPIEEFKPYLYNAIKSLINQNKDA